MLWFSSYVIVFEFSWKVKEKKIGGITYWLTLVNNGNGVGHDVSRETNFGEKGKREAKKPKIPALDHHRL